MLPLTSELRIALQMGSGALWTLTYLLLILRGFQDKTYGMPLFALCLNVSWEFIFSFLYPPEGIQIVVNWIWFLFDLVIVWQALRFGPAVFRNPKLGGTFYPVFLVILLVSFFGVLTMSAEFSDWLGKYAAFTQNLVMSILFISMLLSRDQVAGQSIYIAIFKLIGTLLASIWFYLTNPNEPYLNYLYVTIVLFDATYAVLLYRKFQAEGINPWIPLPTVGTLTTPVSATDHGRIA